MYVGYIRTVHNLAFVIYGIEHAFVYQPVDFNGLSGRITLLNTVPILENDLE